MAHVSTERIECFRVDMHVCREISTIDAEQIVTVSDAAYRLKRGEWNRSAAGCRAGFDIIDRALKEAGKLFDFGWCAVVLSLQPNLGPTSRNAECRIRMASPTANSSSGLGTQTAYRFIVRRMTRSDRPTLIVR